MYIFRLSFINKGTVFCLCQEIKKKFPTKTIWIYTGYDWETIMNNKYMKAVMKYVDVLVDGEFIEELKDVNYPWAGSTNQRVIDVQKSLKEGKVILHESN
jgi:anaerobic ribonucleoside-triphosphate reductase activating protein